MPPERSPPILERDSERRALGDLIEDARTGRGRMLLIEGEPGIGKTSLLVDAAERARADGIGVLAARAGELESDFSFGIVRQLLEPTYAAADARGRKHLTAGAARLAEPVFTAHLAEGAAGPDPRHATLHGLYWLTANLAQRAPLLLAIDDIHWADDPSLRYLLHLARRLDGLPLAVVLTVRAGESPAQGDLVRALTLETRSPVLRPAPLSEGAVGTLVHAALGDSSAPTLSGACLEATGGNPFLLGALLEELRHAASPGAIDPARIRQLGSNRIAAAILLRLGRLGSSAPRFARAAAVLGGGADLDRATRLAGVEPEEGRALVDRLASAAILDGGEPLRFVHPIVRTAIYEDTPERERAALHAQAAAVLRSDRAEDEAIAVHLLAVPPAANETAVQTLRRAATVALSRGAPENAVRYLRRALREPPSESEQAGLIHALGLAEVRAGDPGGVDRLKEAMAMAPAGRTRAEMALVLGAVLNTQGSLVEAVEVLDAALTELPESEHDLRVELEAHAAIAARLSGETRRRSANRLRRFAEDADSETPSGRTLLAGFAFQKGLDGGSAAEAASVALRAFAGGLLADQDPASLAPPVWDAVYTLAVAERFSEAERYSTRSLANARESGSVGGILVASGFLSFIAYRRGQIARAESEARTALEAAEAAGYQAGMSGTSTGLLIDALIERGELEPARAALEREWPGEEMPDSVLLYQLLYARGCLRLAAGEAESGLADLRLLHERAVVGGRSPLTQPYLNAALAVELARRGDVAEAGRLADEDVRIARAWGTPGAIGSALRAQGVVEGGRRGIDLLTEAASTLEGSETRLEQARALVDLGAVLRRARKQSDARGHLAEGMDLADRCGAVTLADRAEEELRLAGARPRRRALTGVDSLTPSERRVAELAAEGMSNKEIAQALFVTLRTVEMHLSNAYRKLDISSRRQLPRALARE